MKTAILRPVLDLEATGAKIKTLMKQRGITPRQLQTILDFPYVQTIYNWFSAKNMPTLDNLVVLAQVLGVTMDDIVVTRMISVEIDACGAVEPRLQNIIGNREADDKEGVEVLSA